MPIQRPILFPAGFAGLSLVRVPRGLLNSAAPGIALPSTPRRKVTDAGDLVRETQVASGNLTRTTQADAGALTRTTVETAGSLTRETSASAGDLERETQVDAGDLCAGEEV